MRYLSFGSSGPTLTRDFWNKKEFSYCQFQFLVIDLRRPINLSISFPTEVQNHQANKPWWNKTNKWISNLPLRDMLRMLRFINYIFFCYVKPGANGRNIVANNSQHCSMLHVASICTPCCMLLRFVGICCVKSETGQTLSYMQTDATTPNNVGSCWPTMLRPIAPGFTFLYYIFFRVCQ